MENPKETDVEPGAFIKELVKGNDPILREEMEPFDFSTRFEEVHDITHSLAQTLIHHEGLGLACPQIGIRARACAFRGEKQIFVMFNPNIVDIGDAEAYNDEGCLSLPNLVVKVKRPTSIRVQWFMPNGEGRTDVYAGQTARVIQHEIDHLDGILMTDRATGYHLEQAKKKKAKYEKQLKRNANRSKVSA